MLDEFDPEIDPSIREEIEQAQRQKELEERVNAIVDEKIRIWQSQAGIAPEQDERTAEQEPDGQKPRRSSRTKKAVRSILSGSVLSSPEMKKLYPYLLATAALLLLLITSTFYIQKLYRRQSRLEGEIKELRTRAVELSAERVQQTSRSGIVRRIEKQGLELEESVTPVKVIE